MIIGKTRTNQPVESDTGFDKQVEEVATTLIEGGQIENAKPIYWHSITLKRIVSNELYYYFDFIIINNSNEQFTLSSFLSWLNSFETTIEIKCVQGFISAHPNNLISYFTRGANVNSIYVYSVDTATGLYDTNSYGALEEQGTSLIDNAVNKIN